MKNIESETKRNEINQNKGKGKNKSKNDLSFLEKQLE